MEATDKKEFGGEEILKAGIFPFMALSKLGHGESEHYSVDKQQVSAGSGALGDQ